MSGTERLVDELNEAESSLRALSASLHGAKLVCDTELERAIRQEAAPIARRARIIRGQLLFDRTVPMRWMTHIGEEELRSLVHADQLRAVLDDAPPPNNLLLVGPTGAGKSVVLGLLLRRACLAKRCERPRWAFARALAAAPLEHALGQGEAPEVEAAKNADLLILDDLGHERDHGTLFDVLHHRYERSLPTWSSSGFPVDQLTERHGEAFVRRLLECGGQSGVIVDAFGGQS